MNKLLFNLWRIAAGVWKFSLLSWWWAAPVAYFTAWGLPEWSVRRMGTAETPLTRGVRVACFAAAALALLLAARLRRGREVHYVFDPAQGRVILLPWSDRFLAVSLAQWAWLALPLSAWAVLRVVG